MRLQYSTLDITIPDPQLGNTDTYKPESIIRTNRSQQAISFKASEWPVNIRRMFNCKCLTRSERDDLTDFLNQSDAALITLTDHDGYIWSGIISSETVEFVNLGPDEYDVSFEFLGSRV